MTDYPALVKQADPGLNLPIYGKVYRVDPVGYYDGLTLAALVSVGVRLASRFGLNTEVANDADEDILYRRALGDPDVRDPRDAPRNPAHSQMIADHLDFATIKLAAMTTIWHTVWGEDKGREYWQTNAGEALAPEPPAPGPSGAAPIATPTAR